MGLLKKFGVLKPKSVTDQKSLDHWINSLEVSKDSQVLPGLSDDPPIDPLMIHDPNLLDQLPVSEFSPELYNHLYARSILWLEDEIEAAWKNQSPVLIKIPADCDVKPTLIEERTKQRLERYWTARPHTGSLMSACLLGGVGFRLLLYRVPQDIQLLNFTLPMPEMAKFYSPQEQQLLDSVQRFADHCRAGEIWEIPEHWMPDAVELAKDVDFMVKKRTSELGVWKNENTLVCGPRSHF